MLLTIAALIDALLALAASLTVGLIFAAAIFNSAKCFVIQSMLPDRRQSGRSVTLGATLKRYLRAFGDVVLRVALTTGALVLISRALLWGGVSVAVLPPLFLAVSLASYTLLSTIVVVVVFRYRYKFWIRGHGLCDGVGPWSNLEESVDFKERVAYVISKLLAMVAAIVMGTLGSILVAPIDIRTVSVTADLEVLAPEVVLATSILACLLFGALAARFLSIPQYGLIYSGAEKLRDGLDGYLEGGRDISFRGAQWPSGRNRAVIVLSRLFLRSVESVSSRFPTGSAEVFYANSRRISGELVQMASGDAREYSEPRFLNLIRGMLYVAVSSDPVGSSSRVVEDLDIGSNYQSFPHTAGDRIVRRLGLILNSRALALFGKSYGAILAVLAVLFVGPARTIEWLMSTFKP